MKKIFISCPMKGRTEEDIRKTRDKMHKYAELVFEEEKCVIIATSGTDPSLRDANKSIWWLGTSIKRLSLADVFVGLDRPYWVDAKGCDIEEKVAMGYGIKRLMISADAFEYFCPDLKNESRYDGKVCDKG